MKQIPFGNDNKKSNDNYQSRDKGEAGKLDEEWYPTLESKDDSRMGHPGFLTLGRLSKADSLRE